VALFLGLAPHGVAVFEHWPQQADWRIERGVVAPEATTVDLLRVHMTGDMAFNPASVTRKRAYLTTGLRGAIADWFKRPRPQDGRRFRGS